MRITITFDVRFLLLHSYKRAEFSEITFPPSDQVRTIYVPFNVPFNVIPGAGTSLREHRDLVLRHHLGDHLLRAVDILSDEEKTKVLRHRRGGMGEVR